MSRTDSLFELIHSLTSSEKRRFRLRSARYDSNGQKNYLKLFEYLDSAKTYSTESINEHFKGEPLLNNISVAKQFLRRAVLDVLQEPKRPIKSLDLAQTFYDDACIYEEKRMLYEAARSYRKSAKLSKQRWDEVLRYKALLSLSRVLPLLKREGKFQKETDWIHRETLQTARRIHEQAAIFFINNKLYAEIIRQGTDRRQLSRELEELIDGKDFSAAANSINPETRAMYHHVLSQRHFVYGQMSESYVQIKLALEVFRTEKEWIRQNPITYIGYINNMLGRALVADHWQDLPKLLNDLALVPARNRKSSDKKFQTEAYYGIINAVLSGSPLSESQLNSFESGLSRPGIDKAFVYGIQFELGVYAFVFGFWDRAASWLNRVLNDTSFDNMLEMSVYAKLLRLIIHLEQDETDLLNYGLENWKRKRRAVDMLEFEKVIIDALTEWTGAALQQRSTIFSNLTRRLHASRSTDRYQMYFDFQLWAKCKKDGDVLSENLRKRHIEAYGIT